MTNMLTKLSQKIIQTKSQLSRMVKSMIANFLDEVAGIPMELGLRVMQTKSQLSRIVHSLHESLSIDGDVAECGVAFGGVAATLLKIMNQQHCSKTLHLFDTFEGIPDIATTDEKRHWQKKNTGIQLHQMSLPSDKDLEAKFKHAYPNIPVEFHKGLFQDTIPKMSTPLCFIHADGDFYQSTKDIILLADRCLMEKGHIVFHDYRSPRLLGVTQAINEWTARSTDYDYVASARRQCIFRKKSK